MTQKRIAASRLAPGEKELQRVEQLLERTAPSGNQSWSHLLNALLVEAERPQVNDAMLKALQNALFVLMGSAGAATLQKPLSAMVQAARLRPDKNPVRIDKDGNKIDYSFTEETVEFVEHLRYDLGLSALYTCRHLRDHFGAPTPPAALLALIASVDLRPPRLGQ